MRYALVDRSPVHLYVYSRVWAQHGATARGLAMQYGHTEIAAFLQKVRLWVNVRAGDRVVIMTALHIYGGRENKYARTLKLEQHHASSFIPAFVQSRIPTTQLEYILDS